MDLPGSATNVGKATVSEFLTDLLGSLLPGMLFLTATSLVGLVVFIGAVAPTTRLGRRGLPHAVLGSALEATRDTPSIIWVLLGLLFLALSYITGHLLYRRDPKVPNRASFSRIARGALVKRWQSVPHETRLRWRRYRHRTPRRTRSEIETLRGPEFVMSALGINPGWVAFDAPRVDPPTTLSGVELAMARFTDPCHDRPRSDQAEVADDIHAYVAGEVDWLRGEFACESMRDCEFPFPYIRRYLRQRNHSHLTKYVHWCGPEENRSKTAVNRYKLAIEAHFPSRYRRLVRNEAHVRLSTSTWYAAGALKNFGLGAAAAMLGLALLDALGWTSWDTPGFELAWHLEQVLTPLAVAVVAWYLRRSVEGYNHYQRLREVFFVLEMASICELNEIPAPTK